MVRRKGVGGGGVEIKQKLRGRERGGEGRG